LEQIQGHAALCVYHHGVRGFSYELGDVRRVPIARERCRDVDELRREWRRRERVLVANSDEEVAANG
jgi:hypothetical protein